MWLIIVEALAAGLILVGIVWWTMFSGRRGGERRVDTVDLPPDPSPDLPPDLPPRQRPDDPPAR